MYKHSDALEVLNVLVDKKVLAGHTAADKRKHAVHAKFTLDFLNRLARTAPSMKKDIRSVGAKIAQNFDIDDDGMADAETEDQKWKRKYRAKIKSMVTMLMEDEESLAHIAGLAQASMPTAELDYESGAFKIVVDKTQRSTFDVRKVIAAGKATGSGFLVDAERRLIVTNGHVVADADRIIVLHALQPTVEMVAKVVKVSFDSDIAIIKIEDDKGAWSPKKMRAYALATPDNGHDLMFIHKIVDTGDAADDLAQVRTKGFLRMQHVYAVGYPLGSSRVQISEGIVSGFEGVFDEVMIQTTAPISHGSSGGALLNGQGKVIGVTSAGSENGENIGYAIPVQTVANMLQTLDKDEYKDVAVIKFPYIGVDITDGSKINGLALMGLSVQKAPDSSVASENENKLEGTAGGAVTKQPAYMFSAATTTMAKSDVPLAAVPKGVFITKIDPISVLANPTGGDMVPILPFDCMVEFAGFPLENNGTTSATYPRNMPYTFVFRSLPFFSTFSVKFWRSGRYFTNEYVYKPINTLQDNNYGIRKIEKEELLLHPTKKMLQDYQMFEVYGQLTLIRLSVNFVERAQQVFPWVAFYAEKENQVDPLLMVLDDKNGIFSAGDIIHSFDGRKIGTREMLLDYVKEKLVQGQAYSLVQTTTGKIGYFHNAMPQGNGLMDLVKLMTGAQSSDD